MIRAPSLLRNPGPASPEGALAEVGDTHRGNAPSGPSRPSDIMSQDKSQMGADCSHCETI